MIKVFINRADYFPLTNKVILRLARAAAKIEPKINGLVEINFVDNREMRRLNRVTRGFDKPTDVLSFSWREDDIQSPRLGELYLSYRYIKDQARRFKVPAKEECARMLSHGLLHLSGHDHTNKKAADKMFARQEKIVLLTRPVIL